MKTMLIAHELQPVKAMVDTRTTANKIVNEILFFILSPRFICFHVNQKRRLKIVE